MEKMFKKVLAVLVFALLFSCESEQEKKQRLIVEEKTRIEAEKIQAAADKVEAERLEKERLEQEKIAAEEKLKQEMYDKYISNTLSTGSTPYSKYYGGNSSCSDYGCSQIKVRTSNSDVLVTIKKNDEVVRHAYIQAGDGYTFSFPNGTYQAFFYYGKGWNPEKLMKGGQIKGGFIDNEEFGKDDPQALSNNVLEYELILQQNGNFSTRPSNPDEAL